MKITVKLFAAYRIGRFSEAVQEHPDGAPVDEVLQSLNIARMRGVVLVNGKPAAQDQLLSDGDTLTLFPLVSGG